MDEFESKGDLPKKKPHRHFAHLSLLGERICGLRKKRGLSLEGLAYACDMSKGNLSDIEKGKRDPRYCTLRAIAQVLEMSLSEMLESLQPDVQADHLLSQRHFACEETDNAIGSGSVQVLVQQK